ncbi:hypothetical protein HDU76_005264 [Blyttiomyces sp. JEL0837]|nr:hypothetical protein HDU76_005264 [Blyttiomyces sp. JEL0837]
MPFLLSSLIPTIAAKAIESTSLQSCATLKVPSTQWTIPSALSTIPTLAAIELQKNYFTGSLPEFPDIHRAIEIFSYLNCLSTTVPPSLRALGTVAAKRTRFNVMKMDALYQSPRDLPLQLNKVADLNPAFGGLQHLRSLSASNIRLGRMQALGDLVNLETIYIDKAIGRGVVPGEIFQSLTKLQSAILTSVCVELGSFGRLENLKDLILYNTGCNSYSSLSDTIDNLVSLRNLTLSSNSIRGEIPDWLGDLVLLENLQLDGNMFNGSIPSTIGNLVNLKALYERTYEIRLNSNFLQGDIPQEVGLLPNLSILDIEANGLTGTVPLPLEHLEQLKSGLNCLSPLPDQLVARGFSQQEQLTPNQCENRQYQPSDCLALLEGFPSLEFTRNCCYYWDIVICNEHWQITGLVLVNASLSGPIPSSLKKLEKLSFLNLRQNNLNGTIPNWLTDLPLRYINLRHNNVTGSLPDLHDNWKDLTDIDVSGNSLSGPLPHGLWSLTKLQNLDLSFNYFTGQLSPDIANLQALDYLTLAWNYFNGTIPESLWSISQLSEIDLSHNSFSGALPPVIQNFENLEIFIAGHNLFVGDIPPELGSSFDSINRVDLSHNMLTGIPKEIVESPYIQELDISYNMFTGAFPSGFGSKSALRSLKMGDNAFTGPFPRFLENIISLQSLYLDNTLMEGSIPENWRLLTSLTTLHLKNNSISGSIPDFLGTFSSLQDLDLSNNKLSGLIPSSMGNLTSLKALDLHDNPLDGPFPETTNISGTLPDSLQNLQSVTTIGLWDNWITGEIPPSLGNLSSLTFFWINDNLLNGSVPESFERLSNLKDINLSDNCMTGTLPQKLLDKNFILYNQREVCSKYSLPTNKPTNPSSTKKPTAITVSTDSKFVTKAIPVDQNTVLETITSTSFLSPSNTPLLIPNNNNYNSNQLSSNQTVVIGTTSGVLCAVLVAIFAVFIWRKNRREEIGEKNKVTNVSDLTKDVTSSGPNTTEISQTSATRSSEIKNHDPQPTDDYRPHIYFSNLTPISSAPTSKTRITAEHNTTAGRPRVINPLNITITHTNLPPDPAHGEVDPAIVAHFQRLAEEQPINTIELEQGLQRTYGVFSSWSHELVKEWVRLRNFDAVVVQFITGYYVDGSMLNNLSMSVLQEKYKVQEFRHRAMIMQAVEFLRHSSIAPGVDSDVLNTDMPLPLYED